MKLGVGVFGPRPAVDDNSEKLARRYIGLSAAAFLVIFGLLWIYTATLPMAFLARDYPAWLVKQTIVDSCSAGAVAFFGDSRAMAGIDPRSLPFPASNLAFSGSTPIEAYFTAKRMLRCKTQPKTIVLAYSVGNYMSDSDYWNISARIGILNFADMRNVQGESRLLGDDEILREGRGDHLSPLIREALFATRFPSFYFSSLIDGYGFGRYFYNRSAERAISLARGHALFGTDPGSGGVASEIVSSHFAASPLINAYLQSMLAAIAQKNIPVVIISTPINEATCRAMDASLRPALQAYLQHAIANLPQMRFVGPTMPCWPDRLFGDAFHLNSSGAAIYTQLVAHWLQPEMLQTSGKARIVEPPGVTSTVMVDPFQG